MPLAKRLGVLLATLGGNLFLVAGSALFGGLAVVIGWLPPRGNLMFWCARLWSRGLLAASRVRVERQFEHPLDGRGRYIFMANHQSLFDIPVLISTLPGQVRFLAKRSLFRIPIFGWALAAGGFIPVDRDERRRARQTFAAAVARLEAGSSVLLFPEETRSLDGSLLPFKGGGFLLAYKSGLPIVPVGIRGTLEVQPRGRRLIRPGKVTVRYGVPVEVFGRGLRDKPRLMEEVRDTIARLAGLGRGGGMAPAG